MATRVTPSMNTMLTSPVTDEEIKTAVFLLGGDKAPGHDGFSAAFYQQFWGSISSDVCRMVRKFFCTGVLEPNINHTHLCLLPKIRDAVSMGDYRPISLCTVSYKIVSKIMVLRLKSCLGQLISNSQAAIVPGRQITDNILIAHELLHALKSKRDCASTYMAIKTDISKAYDRVEWNFLEAVMQKMGFASQWIHLVMACIRSVTYSVLINGAPYGHICPSRGLRQGDPLSPYLFLLCAESLSQMLSQAAARGDFSGFKLTRSSPVITHLLFADDSLFFCKATSSDCRQMAKLLLEYEAISGQKVNLEKSSIIFGQRIDHSQRQLLMRILGIHSIGGGGKYLGLPEQFGRTKVNRFQNVVDKVKASVNGWYNKFLSPAGKEILIKSVALAKPVYSMNCFLLPKSTCDEIARTLSSFWWGRNEFGRRKISWLAWRRLALPKQEGGLGFRDLYSFNLALLAKQAWRIYTNPNSLLARLYRSRYHWDTDFLSSTTGKNSSYGWRSLQAGLNLLHHGLQVRLGDGKNTKVWSDKWLPVLPLRTPQPLGEVANPDLRVADLWIANSRIWNDEALSSVFAPADVTLAKSLRLSRYGVHDHVIWAYTSHAQYTVKSGYWLSTHIDQVQTSIPPPSGSLELKQVVWKLCIQPKIQHFIWKALAGALPTAERLQTRSVYVDPTCQRCGLHIESMNHILFTCPYAQAVWRCCQIRIFDAPNALLEDNFRVLFMLAHDHRLASEQRLLPLWIVWILWKSRNALLFKHTTLLPHEDATKGFHLMQEWLLARRLLPSTPSFQSDAILIRSLQWEPPPLGWYKCNFDATFRTNSSYMGVGWILRTSTGSVVEAGCVKLPLVLSALQAEASAFLYVLQRVWCRGWRYVWFESDCRVLSTIINRSEDHVELGNLLIDIRHWLPLLRYCSLAHVNREQKCCSRCSC